jgi:hypothetical protein
MRVLTAYALNPDDLDGTAAAILEQLDLENNLQKNTVGFLFCYYDFIKTGAVKAVCERLPFDVAGCTTQGIALPQIEETVILALMVLTSDDVEFYTGLSRSLDTKKEEYIEELYKELRTPLKADPPLSFAFIPNLAYFTGDRMVEILDRLSGGALLFGSRAIDLDHRSPMVIYNGEAYSDRICLMMPAGHMEPRFFVDSVINQNIFYQKARISSAKDNRLIAIDNMSAVDYMEKIGIVKREVIESLLAFPILADSNDGTEPKLLIFPQIGPDGSLISISKVPEGGTLSIGFPTAELVLKSAKNLANTVKQEQNRSGVLFLSCFSRNMSLSDPGSEMRKIRKYLADFPYPYLFLYSGGEICPWNRNEGAGKLINRFNTYALVACTF